MPKIADRDEQIGRRLRLRDLRVFFAVLETGSLAKAAELLRVSQPAVSQVVGGLEHALGVKPFDRSTRGVEPTLYARALLVRGRAAFDELTLTRNMPSSGVWDTARGPDLDTIASLANPIRKPQAANDGPP